MISQGWKEVKISEIGVVVTGNTPPTHDRSFYGGEIPFVAPGDLGFRKYITTSEKTITERGLAVCRPIPAGATLFTCIGSTIGKIGLAAVPLATNQQINSVIPEDNYDPEFIYYQLANVAERIAKMAGAHAVPIIAKSQFSAEKILVPTLVEQRRIAEILSTWDRAIETVEALIANARAQKAALMQILLTGKRRLPGFSSEWERAALGGRGDFRKGKGISRAEVKGAGIPCVRYGEIYTRHDDIVRDFGSFIDTASASRSEPIIRSDILFACSGETAEEIGKCVAYLGDHEAYAGGDIVIFSPERDNPVFLAYLLNSPPLVMQKSQMGQGNSVVHISASNLAKLQIVIPELDEQDAIAQRLLDSDTQISSHQFQLTALRQERAALMQQLLTGKRRVRVPAEAAQCL